MSACATELKSACVNGLPTSVIKYFCLHLCDLLTFTAVDIATCSVQCLFPVYCLIALFWDLNDGIRDSGLLQNFDKLDCCQKEEKKQSVRVNFRTMAHSTGMIHHAGCLKGYVALLFKKYEHTHLLVHSWLLLK